MPIFSAMSLGSCTLIPVCTQQLEGDIRSSVDTPLYTAREVVGLSQITGCVWILFIYLLFILLFCIYFIMNSKSFWFCEYPGEMTHSVTFLSSCFLMPDTWY